MGQSSTFLKGLMLVVAALFTACSSTSTGTSGSGYSNDGTNNDEDADPAVYMFSAGQYTGNLGGRNGADQFCIDALPTELEGMEVHAFISVDATDEIADIPVNYGLPLDLEIINPATQTAVASSFADLLDGTLSVSLEAAGILTSSDTFWSGSNPNGTLTMISCSGWTSSLASIFGAAGSPIVTTLWTYAISAACNGPRDLLCVAY